MYEKGEGVSQSDVEAAKWYRKAAEQENDSALNSLTAMCNRGSSVAQFNLGLMYEEGDGVAQDDDEAAKWFQQAADQGHKIAKSKLDKMKDK
jgi:TPR repeat protein